MNIQLRDYQQKLKNDIYNSWNAGNRNVLAVLPTGGGKTQVFADIVLDHHNIGQRCAVMAHRNELVTQMSTTIASRGIPHRIIGSASTVQQAVRKHRAKFGKSFINPSAPTAVIGVDTLIARKDEVKDWCKQINLWVGDECFPAGTKISTPSGFRNIESIKIGDDVTAFDEKTHSFETKKVSHLFKNPIHNDMMRLTTKEHHVIDCTFGHPFWTRRGWVKAEDLNIEDEVLNVRLLALQESSDTEKVRKQEASRKSLLLKRMFQQIKKIKNISTRHLLDLRKHRAAIGMASTESFSQNRKGLLFPDLLKGIFSKTFFRNDEKDKHCSFSNNLSADEEKKPNGEIGNQGEIFQKTQGNRSSTERKRWQWKENAFGRTKANRIVSSIRLYASVCHKNWGEKRKWLSDLLQTGHGEPIPENSNRSGWYVTQFDCSATAGYKERCVSHWVGLESIKIQKCRDIGKSLGDFVYNIEVDELNTYVANEIVVHNCQHNIGRWKIDENGNRVYNSDGELEWAITPNKWGKSAAMFVNAKGLGVTATPQRADGQGLGWCSDGLYHDMVTGPSSRYLIDRGFLADYEIVCPDSDLKVDEDTPLSKDGDWSNQTLRKAAKTSHIVGDVVENYIQYALGRKAIVFATDIETANEIAKNFNESGIRAVSLNGKSEISWREQSLNEFENGSLMVMVNVDLFDEGLDILCAEVCIMARPTASLVKYLQSIGRVLRPRAGKIALIIDHVSNVIRHGLPDRHRNWTLGRRDKRGKNKLDPDEIPLTVCRSCSPPRPYEAFRTACPYCGAEKPLPEPRSRTIEMVAGDLILLDRATLAKMRAATELESVADIAGRVRGAVGNFAALGQANRQTEKIAAHRDLQDAIALWAGYERSRGYDDREIQRRFYLTAGVDVLGALNASKTRQELEIMTGIVKGWIK